MAVDGPADHLNTDHKPGEPITAGRRLADAGVIVLLLSSTDPQTSRGERIFMGVGHERRGVRVEWGLTCGQGETSDGDIYIFMVQQSQTMNEE